MSKLEGLRHVQEPKGLLRKPPAPGSPAKFPAEPTFSASPDFSQQQLEEAGTLIQAGQLMELIGAFQNASLTPGFPKLGHSHTAPGLGSRHNLQGYGSKGTMGGAAALESLLTHTPEPPGGTPLLSFTSPFGEGMGAEGITPYHVHLQQDQVQRGCSGNVC